jgi:hypothetical protein
MKCASCGATELIHDTRDQPYINKGEQTVISHVTGDQIAGFNPQFAAPFLQFQPQITVQQPTDPDDDDVGRAQWRASGPAVPGAARSGSP